MLKHYPGPKDKDVLQELKVLGSNLDDIRLDKTYDVPDGFFDRQAETILAKAMVVDTEIAPIAKSKSMLVKYIKVAMGVAASLALVLASYQITSSNTTEASIIEDIDMATLEVYLIDQASYLDTDIAVNQDLFELIED